MSAANIAEIARKTGAREFHLSGKVRQESGMTFRHKEFDREEKVSIDGYAHQVSGVEKISAAIAALL